MSEMHFLFIAFFLTIGAFLLGFMTSWNLKGTFDEWKERAEYAAVVMHPEMYQDGEPVNPSDLLYLHLGDEDDILDDEDD